MAHPWRSEGTGNKDKLPATEAIIAMLQNGRNVKDQDLLERITLYPKVMAGKPVIKGTRLTVEYILNLLAHGATTEGILAKYQGLKPEDILACFLFAKKALGDIHFLPSTVETA